MKTSLYLRIGIIMSLIYYFLDALLDTFIFYKDSTFLDILILDVPLNELYNRFMAIILIVIALLLIRLFSLKDRKYFCCGVSRPPAEDLSFDHHRIYQHDDR